VIRSSLSELVDCGIGMLQGADVEFQGISIDSRTVQPGNVFFAIKGPRFDGHAFCHAALEKGAIAVIVENAITDINAPQLVVTDTTLALGQVAGLWRERFATPVVAVTGSSGKTTVKEMIAAILRQAGPTLSTEGNLNNAYGVPLTLARLSQKDRFAVIEIGASAVGEIADIVPHVQPDVALITMIGPSHLEGFGSIDAIAHAKSEIYVGLRDLGTAVINRDDVYFDVMKAAAPEKTMTFGFDAAADVHGRYSAGELRIAVAQDTISVSLPLPGKHNAYNALAAAAACISVGCGLHQVRDGLRSMHAVKGRLMLRDDVDQYRLIDDSYNANPASVMAAIDVLSQESGVTCLVLGDMLELGDAADDMHAEIGVYASKADIDHLLCIGDHVKHTCASFSGGKAHHADTFDELVAHCVAEVPLGGTVLVKGSRSSRMETFIDALAKKGNAAGGEQP